MTAGGLTKRGGEPDGIIIAWRRGVTWRDARAGGGATIQFHPNGAEIRLAGLGSHVSELLHSFADGASALPIDDGLLDKAGIEGLAEWYATLAMLEEVGAVSYQVRHAGHEVMRFTPAAPGRVVLPTDVSGLLRLSRFAHVRRDGASLWLESPLARGSMELVEARVAAVLGALCIARTPAQLRDASGFGDAGLLRDVLTLLVAGGFVETTDEAGEMEEDRSIGARHWEFADLVMHARSRTSRRDLRVGGTYRLEGSLPPAPPTKPKMSDTRIALPRPDLVHLAQTDEPLASVMERRRSVRKQGETPISIEQLAHFLFRVARAHPPAPNEGGLEAKQRTRRRVYAGGGACHPLEVYAVISTCAGLERGLYHYDPDAHVLEGLEDPLGGVNELVHQSSVPMEGAAPTQVMLVITARFPRMSWKYEGNAYALILQEVGVLLQSMYLVATAMGLAPCAVGGGDAARFAAIIGENPLCEASVGALTLGSAG